MDSAFADPCTTSHHHKPPLLLWGSAKTDDDPVAKKNAKDNVDGKRETDADKDATHFRASSRIFRLNNNEWYFSSREGDHGPFDSDQVAQRELETYIKLMATPTKAAKPAPRKPEESTSDVDKKVWDQFDRLN